MKNIFPKKQILLKILFTITFSCFICLLNAQSATSWTLHSTTDGVKLSYRVDTCSNSHVLFLKFENTNSAPKHVNCIIVVESPGLNIPLLPKMIQLNAKETRTGSCNSDANLKSDIKGIANPSLRVLLNVN